MNTKEEALKMCAEAANHRGEEMFVIHDPKGEDQEHAYSVHTEKSAQAQIGKGCEQVASVKPDASVEHG